MCVMDMLVANAWRVWVNLFAGLGLPWNKQTIATIAAVAFFYTIGVIYRSLTSRE
jgi:hypothetical protein